MKGILFASFELLVFRFATDWIESRWRSAGPVLQKPSILKIDFVLKELFFVISALLQTEITIHKFTSRLSLIVTFLKQFF